MLIVLSPAKTLDFSSNNSIQEHSVPVFIKEAEKLVKLAKKLKPEDLSSLMGISAKLADLNYERFLKWNSKHVIPEAKHAVLAFKGDVYIGLEAQTLSLDQLFFLNQNLRILSGLYGILKPFDLIREYRLEMGISLANPKGKDLYAFWAKLLTKRLNLDVEQSIGEKVLINLASNEYYKSIISKDLKYRVITPIFKEYKNNEYQFVSFFAKKARGMMTRFIALENITKSEQIKSFNLGGYIFNPELSVGDQWTFTR